MKTAESNMIMLHKNISMSVIMEKQSTNFLCLYWYSRQAHLREIVIVFKLYSLVTPPPLQCSITTIIIITTPALAHCHCLCVFSPPGAIWRIWRDWIIESTLGTHAHTHTQTDTHTHTHTHRVFFRAFWWQNGEGSASLPMWRTYILNQIHVCFLCVCVCVCVCPSSSARL